MNEKSLQLFEMEHRPANMGDSQRRQDEMAKTWCQQRGLKLADEKFNDAGVSAKNGANQKQDLGRLVNTVKPGDTVLIEDHDRLSRMDWFSAMDFLRSILAKGVTVVTLATGAEITEEKFRRDPGCF